MRKAFVETLRELARRDPRILLLTADLGYNALEPFAEEFPGRFLNVGVAEQNLLALATGLAEAGFIPYCYSIAPFAVLRPYEFIRNGPILHRLPVRLVAVGGGLDYPTNGASHYGIEDLGVLRVQPGISLYAPADCDQARRILAETASAPGPAYYRLEKDDGLALAELSGRFTRGRPEEIVSGRDVLFVAMGGVASEAVAAARELAGRGVSAGVAILSSLRPLDRAFYADLLRRYRRVITVEAHFIDGGVGSLTAEVIAEEGLPVRLLRRGLTETPDGITGSRAFLYERHGLDHAHLVAAAAP